MKLCLSPHPEAHRHMTKAAYRKQLKLLRRIGFEFKIKPAKIEKLKYLKRGEELDKVIKKRYGNFTFVKQK